MGQFLIDNLFELIASLLLTTVSGLGVYFIRKVEGLEVRVRALEMKNPSIEQRIVALHEMLDERTKHLEEKIDDTKEYLSGKIEGSGGHLQHVAEEDSS